VSSGVATQARRRKLQTNSDARRIRIRRGLTAGISMEVGWKSLWEWSGRRHSNPRPTAWKAVTLPLSYSRKSRKEWWRREDSNLRRAKPGRFTVCCHCPLGHTSKELMRRNGGWSRHPDLNRGPTVYKTVALPLSYAG